MADKGIVSFYLYLCANLPIERFYLMCDRRVWYAIAHMFFGAFVDHLQPRSLEFQNILDSPKSPPVAYGGDP